MSHAPELGCYRTAHSFFITVEQNTGVDLKKPKSQCEIDGAIIVPKFKRKLLERRARQREMELRLSAVVYLFGFLVTDYGFWFSIYCVWS